MQRHRPRSFRNSNYREELNSIRAIVVDPSVTGRLAINEVESPQAGPSEALLANQIDATYIGPNPTDAF